MQSIFRFSVYILSFSTITVWNIYAVKQLFQCVVAFMHYEGIFKVLVSHYKLVSRKIDVTLQFKGHYTYLNSYKNLLFVVN